MWVDRAWRAVPFGCSLASSIVGAVVAGPPGSFAWDGFLVGGFLGFLLGSALLGIRVAERARAGRARGQTMHREAMKQLASLAALGPMRTASPPMHRQTIDLVREIERVEILAATDLRGAIVEAEQLRLAHPKSAALLTRLAIFQLANEDIEAARAVAAEAMRAAVAIGAMPLAVQLFDDFRDHLVEVPAEGTVFASLARVLAERGRHGDALACVRRAEEEGVTEDWANEEIRRVRAQSQS